MEPVFWEVELYSLNSSQKILLIFVVNHPVRVNNIERTQMFDGSQSSGMKIILNNSLKTSL